MKEELFNKIIESIENIERNSDYDTSAQHVQQANYDFLSTKPDYKLILDAYTECHPLNIKEGSEKSARAGWWI
jgi:hypothetical protein